MGTRRQSVHRGLGWLVLLALFGLTAGSAVAAGPAVKDDAGFFSPAAVEQANKQFDQIKQQTGKVINIETAKTLPTELQGQIDGNDASKSAAFAGYARQRLYSLGADIYIFINLQPAHIESFSREPGRSGLTDAGRDRMTKQLAGYFRNKKADDGLINLANSLQKTLSHPVASSPPAAQAPAPSASDPLSHSNTPMPWSPGPSVAPRSSSNGLFGLGGCIGLVVVGVVVLLIIRVIVGLLNRNRGGPPPLSGGGYGNPTYGNYPPTGGYGNTGSGFGRGLFGGLLGGLFGSYVGNRVFGQDHTSSSDSPQHGGYVDPNASGASWGSGSTDQGGASGADFGNSGASSASDYNSSSDFGGGGSSSDFSSGTDFNSGSSDSGGGSSDSGGGSSGGDF